MSYYRDRNDMRGRNLTRGGPERPDTLGMTKLPMIGIGNIAWVSMDD
jgi:hypothetical protein